MDKKNRANKFVYTEEEAASLEIIRKGGMQGELTTEMHAEFSIPDEVDKKHRVWSLLSYCGGDEDEALAKLNLYQLTLADFEKDKGAYKK